MFDIQVQPCHPERSHVILSAAKDLARAEQCARPSAARHEPGDTRPSLRSGWILRFRSG